MDNQRKKCIVNELVEEQAMIRVKDYDQGVLDITKTMQWIKSLFLSMFQKHHKSAVFPLRNGITVAMDSW